MLRCMPPCRDSKAYTLHLHKVQGLSWYSYEAGISGEALERGREPQVPRIDEPNRGPDIAVSLARRAEERSVFVCTWQTHIIHNIPR